MPLTTPIYGFPYPSGTDRVMDGDNAMGALALAIETLLKNSILAARMERQGAHQSIPANTLTDLACNTLIREDDTPAGGIGPQPGNGSITLARPGWYIVSAGVQWASNAAGHRTIQLVGATSGIVAADRGTPAAAGQTMQAIATVVYVAASENYKAQVEHGAGGAIDAQVSPRTHIAAARIMAF